MNKSESIAGLAAALAKAQGQMKGAVKDSANPFFKSKYADLASVVEAIRAAFSANGLSYIQTVEPSDKDEVRVETTLLHASGEWISCGVLALPVSKHDAQGYGSALTYARRYSLSAAVSVAPEEDDGNAAVAAKPNAKDWSKHSEALNAAATLEALQKLFTLAYKEAQRDNDTMGMATLTNAKNKRKEVLQRTEGFLEGSQ
jgi:predicted Zn-dependent protease